MFFCEYSEMSKNTYFEEHLRTAASVSCQHLIITTCQIYLAIIYEQKTVLLLVVNNYVFTTELLNLLVQICLSFLVVFNFFEFIRSVSVTKIQENIIFNYAIIQFNIIKKLQSLFQPHVNIVKQVCRYCQSCVTNDIFLLYICICFDVYFMCV